MYGVMLETDWVKVLTVPLNLNLYILSFEQLYPVSYSGRPVFGQIYSRKICVPREYRLCISPGILSTHVVNVEVEIRWKFSKTGGR